MNIGGFCGIIDIVLVVLFLLFAIIGYKKGFATKIISLLSFIIVIVLAFLFAGQLAKQFQSWNIIYPGIYSNIYGNAEAKLASISGDTVNAKVASLLGWPQFFADMVVKALGGDSLSAMSDAELATAVATKVTGWIMNVICFFIIVIGVFIVLGIVKAIVTGLKKNAGFRIIDGLLGVVLYEVILAAIVCVIFFILNFAYADNWNQGLTDFLEKDMQLGTDNIRVSKWLFEGNFLKNIWELLVGKIGK